MKDKIIGAIYLTLENAKSLYEEAEILYAHKKFGRSYTLYHLAFEECGRFHLLHTFFMKYVSGEIKSKNINYGELKKLGYERHDIKISQSLLSIYTLAYIKLNQQHENTNGKKEELDEIVNQLFDELKELQQNESEFNRLKNVGLYVTFSENNFHLPNKSITVAQYLKIKKIAKLSLDVSQMVINFFKDKGGLENLKETYLEELKSNK